MRQRKRPKKKSATVRVPVDFKARLERFADRNGLSTTDTLRVHGESILNLLENGPPAHQFAAAS